MRTVTETHDFVVCGGGLAGFCAAMAAARQGLKTALVQDRPVLGGNASSEVRVTVHGAAAFHAYARETGILGEALVEERARNHETINENGWTNSVLDMVLYDLAQREPNLTLHLNTTITDVRLVGGISGLARTTERPPASDGAGYSERAACAEADRIEAVIGRVANAETQLVLEAPLFADCTGDALVADLAGCAWRMGTESRAETGEVHAPEQASRDTMGNSIHIRARDIGRDAPFTPPPWAVTHDDPAYFYDQGRKPSDPQGGFWWIEIGVPWHTIHDAETIRHELTRHALGIWDWMKNHDPEMRERTRTFALDWIGQVPGKRESRRVIGLHWLNEHELHANEAFPDEIAFGGWFVDLHTPGGLLAGTSEPASAEGYTPDSEYAAKSYIGPYGIPLRSCIARDVRNLFLAGRDISTTHAALGTVRVMATTAVMGQGIGTAAAKTLANNGDAHASVDLAPAIQQQLLADGCFLPHVAADGTGDLTRSGTLSASSQALLHGIGTDDHWVDGGRSMRHLGRRQPSYPLRCAYGQWLFLSGGRLDEIQLCLDAEAEAQVTVHLRRVASIWDYRRDIEPVASTTLDVPADKATWVTWTCGMDGLETGCYRLDVDACNGVAWRISSGHLPGMVSAHQMSPLKMRRAACAPMAFRLAPPQAVWGPDQITTGVTRPHQLSNAWRSDPGAGFPQHLDCHWDAPRTVQLVQVIFAGHLLGEIHSHLPFYRDPQAVKDYRIQAWLDDEWQDIAMVRDNYQTRNRHDLKGPITTTAMRLLIEATNGDPSATVYEWRIG